MSKLMGTPVMYFNGGVGLIYNKLSQYYMKHVCNAMDLITVRDELSKKHLTLVGITKPIYVGADSVFALTKQFTVEAKKYEKYTITEKSKVGVNVRPWLYKIEDIPPKSRALCENFGGSFSDFVNFKKDIAGTIDYLKQEKSATVIFFPISFWKAKDEYDVELSEEIAQLLTDWDGVTVIRDECTYLKMINQIKQFDLVIGMRLHALVFAAMLNIPMLAISYDPKVDAFMKLIGQEEYLVSINEVTKEVLRKKINLLWEHREAVAKQLEKRVPEIASKSESSAELMVALLNTRRSRIKLVFEGIVLAIRVMPCILYKALLRLLRVVRHISKLPFCLKISFLIEAIRLKLSKIRRRDVT
jgi:polysaccharide pyruvyl transferase WcaK-like protein